jgi:hypothetical protein
MVKFFYIREPGPTDLTWDEKNSVDYLYRPVDLSVLKPPISKKKESQKTNRGSKKKQHSANAAASSNTVKMIDSKIVLQLNFIFLLES